MACNFHFYRAIDSNVTAKHLGELRKKSWRFARAVRKLKALVFFPPDKIREGFSVVVAYIDSHLAEMVAVDQGAAGKIDNFLSYFQRWVFAVCVSSLSTGTGKALNP